MQPCTSPRFRGGVVLARARDLAVSDEPGGPGCTEGGGVLMVNNSNSKGAEFFMGPGVVRVRDSCIVASPGKAILLRINDVLTGNDPVASRGKGVIQSGRKGIVCRPCGVGILGAVGFGGSVRCGPFMCVHDRGSVLGLMAAVVTGAGNRKRRSNRSF